MRGKVGIGILADAEQPTLAGCVAAVRQHTWADHCTVVAVDGGGDPERWTAELGVPAVSGARRGAAWNRNRALAYLRNHTDADVMILLNADCTPASSAWEVRWAWAAWYWGCVSLVPEGLALEADGAGWPERPYWARGFLDHCFAVYRGIQDVVGFFDPRFQHRGWEHLEYNWRCRDLLTSAWIDRPGLWPAIRLDVQVPPVERREKLDPASPDHALFYRIRSEEAGNGRGLWRDPWQSETDEVTFKCEQAAARAVVA